MNIGELDAFRTFSTGQHVILRGNEVIDHHQKPAAYRVEDLVLLKRLKLLRQPGVVDLPGCFYRIGIYHHAVRTIFMIQKDLSQKGRRHLFSGVVTGRGS
jgi:hypothetical protein